MEYRVPFTSTGFRCCDHSRFLICCKLFHKISFFPNDSQLEFQESRRSFQQRTTSWSGCLAILMARAVYSRDQRLYRSVFSPPSTSALEYSGYLATTYCSTYCISVGVMGPDHLRSRPCRVDMASATI